MFLATEIPVGDIFSDRPTYLHGVESFFFSRSRDVFFRGMEFVYGSFRRGMAKIGSLPVLIFGDVSGDV